MLIMVEKDAVNSLNKQRKTKTARFQKNGLL